MTQRNITLTLTDVGRAALVNASQNSMDVQFSAIALGSGTAVLDNTAKALSTQQEQQAIFSASQLGPGQLSISALFNADPAAAYPATELALIGDGVLFGVWSTNDPTQALVVRTPGVPYTATITVGYAQLPSQNVSVVIQPLDAAAQALVGDAVANAINAHLAAADPHPQYALKAGTTFTGPVNVPMPAAGDNSALAAPTAWVSAAIAALVNSAPGTLDTLKQLADAIGDDPNFSVTLANALALKAALAGSANQVFSVGSATQSSHAVPLGQVQTMLGNFAGSVTLNGAVTLTSAAFGSYCAPPNGSTGGFTVTLPAAAGNNTHTLTFFNSSSGNITLAAGNFNTSYGTGVSSIVLPPGGTVKLECDGTSYNGVGGSGAIGGAVRPQTASGVGQISLPVVTAGTSGAVVMPAGGTWMYFFANGFGAIGYCGIAAGGTTVLTGAQAVAVGTSGGISGLAGFCLRIA